MAYHACSNTGLQNARPIQFEGLHVDVTMQGSILVKKGCTTSQQLRKDPLQL